MKPVSALARGDIKLAYDRAVAHDVEDVGDMLIAFADYICNMEKQRDELLAAAEAIEINAEECMDFDDCTAMLVPIDDYHKLMEAIASAKGGA